MASMWVDGLEDGIQTEERQFAVRFRHAARKRLPAWASPRRRQTRWAAEAASMSIRSRSRSLRSAHHASPSIPRCPQNRCPSSSTNAAYFSSRLRPVSSQNEVARVRLQAQLGMPFPNRGRDADGAFGWNAGCRRLRARRCAGCRSCAAWLRMVFTGRRSDGGLEGRRRQGRAFGVPDVEDEEHRRHRRQDGYGPRPGLYAPLVFSQPGSSRGHLRGGRVLEVDEKAVQRGIGREAGDEFEKLEIVAAAAPAAAQPEELVERAAVRFLDGTRSAAPGSSAGRVSDVWNKLSCSVMSPASRR